MSLHKASGLSPGSWLALSLELESLDDELELEDEELDELDDELLLDEPLELESLEELEEELPDDELPLDDEPLEEDPLEDEPLLLEPLEEEPLGPAAPKGGSLSSAMVRDLLASMTCITRIRKSPSYSPSVALRHFLRSTI